MRFCHLCFLSKLTARRQKPPPPLCTTADWPGWTACWAFSLEETTTTTHMTQLIFSSKSDTLSFYLKVEPRCGSSVVFGFFFLFMHICNIVRSQKKHGYCSSWAKWPTGGSWCLIAEDDEQKNATKTLPNVSASAMVVCDFVVVLFF